MSDQIAIVEIPHKKPATFTVYDSEDHFITLVIGMTQKTGISPPEDFHDATEFFCWDLKSHITVRSAADVDTVEAWTGSQIELVRAMAAELREFFPAETESEPDDEYIFHCEDGNKILVCSNCKYPAETRRGRLGGESAREKLRCKVCNDAPRARDTPGMCYHTNVFLAALEKLRPAEGELATPAELKIRELACEYRTSFQSYRATIEKFGRTGWYEPGEGISETKCACRFAADFMDILDSEEPKDA